MLLIVLIGWAGVATYVSHSFVDAINGAPTLAARANIVVVMLWLWISSFYATYHLMSFAFSLGVKCWGGRLPRHYGRTPAVAILYTCMNDVRENAVAACLAQDYSNYTVYVLDDSTISEERDRVDRLPAVYGDRLTVIRRANRSGYKAGNLNHALGIISPYFEYVCVVDADELLPVSFVTEMVALAEAHPHIGFVQAAHRPYGRTPFAKVSGEGIDLHWDHFFPARNYFGCVYSYGHGVLMRVHALAASGGFPEVVADDVGVSAALRERGYPGLFAYDVIAYEEAPASYHAFRTRSLKVVTATLEFLWRLYPSFFRSGYVSFIEKLDLLIALTVVLVPVVFGLFLVLTLGLSMVYSLSSGSPFSQSLGQSAPMASCWRRGDVTALAIFSILGPMVYLLPALIRSPIRVAAHMLYTTTVHVSLLSRTVRVGLQWLLTGRSAFNATGDRQRPAAVSTVDHLESAVGLIILAIGAASGALYLVGLGVAMSLVSTLTKRDFGGILLHIVAATPLLFAAMGTLQWPLALIGVGSMTTALAIAHY